MGLTGRGNTIVSLAQLFGPRHSYTKHPPLTTHSLATAPTDAHSSLTTDSALNTAHSPPQAVWLPGRPTFVAAPLAHAFGC